MKKGWKIFWIVCAVLAAVGLLLTAAGVVLGGISALRSAQNLEVGITPRWLERLENREQDEEASEPGMKDGVIHDHVDEISLELGGIQVCVTAGDTDGVQVDTSALRSDIREELMVSRDENELEIEMRHRGHGMNTNGTGTLYITVPEDRILHSFSAWMGAGSLELDGIRTEELSLEVGAGEIIAENFYTEELDADCGAGQIRLQGETVREAEIDCDLGQIIYTVPGTERDYNYELSCGAGELLIGGDSFAGVSKNEKIDHESERLIKADCGMGLIEIRFQ